ncbi:MAG: hypothetical protein F2840_14620 [Actinobacteria bacterium]|uniref:Unannotated protein n=1 Tax=freshwater metagenome TaxID=449393 RepID=A0A6J7LNN4_9ZZZZ|nr:hypothetical protein [Actinomycetota bacterium]
MITIHCGLHKTGSSSIQLALELCSTRGRTIVTPKPGDDRSEQGWRERLSKVSRAQHAVFSDENFLGSPYAGYQLAPERIAMLREALHGARYQIVVYIRPQLDWLPSVYLQSVQEGMTTGPEAFWASIKGQPYLRWTTLLDLLQRESSAERVIARAHTRSRDTVHDFFVQVGLGKPSRTGPTKIRENISIAAVQAPLLLALNSDTGFSGRERPYLRNTFQNILAAGARSGLSPFPVGIQVEIVEQFGSDWSELAELVASTDQAEATIVRESLALWRADPLPFAGSTLDAPLIREEMLRSLRTLASEVVVPSREGIRRRMAAKLRSDPRDFPAAVARALWRRSAT